MTRQRAFVGAALGNVFVWLAGLVLTALAAAFYGDCPTDPRIHGAAHCMADGQRMVRVMLATALVGGLAFGAWSYRRLRRGPSRP